jgi:hypothetical protein
VKEKRESDALMANPRNDRFGRWARAEQRDIEITLSRHYLSWRSLIRRELAHECQHRGHVRACGRHDANVRHFGDRSI